MSEHVEIIAEAGVNHNGSLALAFQLVDAAAEAGADVVKFQTFKAENLVSQSAGKAEYQKVSGPADESQLAMLKKLELTDDHHRQLIDHCAKRKIHFLSTPFDFSSLDLLVDKYALRRLKISSGDLTNAPLLFRAAKAGCDVILSSGMATTEEIEDALGTVAFGYLCPHDKPSAGKIRLALNRPEAQPILQKKVSLLHCTSEYPAPFKDINLRVLKTLEERYGLRTGLSDHSKGISVPIAAVALGARIIEKHFTLDRTLPGPDHQASLEPSELQAMVRSIREVELAMGHSEKKPAASEIKNIPIARKSLIAAQSVRRGEVFSEENLTVKRPGSGVSPLHYWDWLGRTASRDYKKDELID